MLACASLTTRFLAFTLSSCVLSAQDRLSSTTMGAAEGTGALQGKVLSPSGKPLAGVHVELDEARTAIPITSTYTQIDGSFEMYNIPKGEYEVVAESQDTEISNLVRVEIERPTLELRFPRDSPSPIDSAGTISVAQILAPERARKLYYKALEAFRNRQNDAAKKLLEQALGVEPEYADALTLGGLLELGNPDLSVPQQNFEHALRLNPKDTRALIALAAVYNHESRFDDALGFAEAAIALNPRAWQAYLEMAKASIGKKLFAEGLLSIRKSERLGGTKYAEVHLVKAIGLFHLKLYPQSKYEVQAAIARDPNGPTAELARRLLTQVNEVETALAEER
jgi:tetratricopeptide (TPR) repeat protein